MDVFVYFSHTLVATPPVGWINAGHRNGVPVLGTFIVEWAEGAAIAARAFESRAAAERTAQQLAAVAHHFGFDGWLVRCCPACFRLRAPAPHPTRRHRSRSTPVATGQRREQRGCSQGGQRLPLLRRAAQRAAVP